MVLAVEVGGRWSGETRGFLSQLARARATPQTRAEPGLDTPVGSDAWMCCCEGGGIVTVELARQSWG